MNHRGGEPDKADKQQAAVEAGQCYRAAQLTVTRAIGMRWNIQAPLISTSTNFLQPSPSRAEFFSFPIVQSKISGT